MNDNRGDLYWALATINQATGLTESTGRFECGYCGESLAVQVREGQRTRLVQGTVPMGRLLGRPGWRATSHPLWRCWLRMWLERER